MTRRLNGIGIYANIYNAVDYAEYTENQLRTSLYRPFAKSNLFFDRILNNCVYLFPSIFPTPETENRAICVSPPGTKLPFHALMVDVIPDLHITGDSQCFPFYTYDEDGTNRRENITDWALAEFRDHYGDNTLSKVGHLPLYLRTLAPSNLP